MLKILRIKEVGCTRVRNNLDQHYFSSSLRFTNMKLFGNILQLFNALYILLKVLPLATQLRRTMNLRLQSYKLTIIMTDKQNQLHNYAFGIIELASAHLCFQRNSVNKQRNTTYCEVVICINLRNHIKVKLSSIDQSGVIRYSFA